MEIVKILQEIQSKLVAPKSQFNSFGNYKYRNCEDILEALKPLLKEKGAVVIVEDEVVMVGDRFYVKATATLSCGGEILNSKAYAREPIDRKGMDASQITGATSSYARKYALNGLFAIDDSKDPDSTNNHEIKPLTASVEAVKTAVSAVKPAPVVPKSSELEFKGVLLSSKVKEGTSKSTGKPYKVTEYTVQSDLGQIDISVFGSPIEVNPGSEITFFEFVKGEFKGKAQYKANKAVAVNNTITPEEIPWEE